MKKIKVGILRCDTHAAWYATLMAAHDPLRFSQPLADPDAREESWQSGGVHYFHYSHYSDPKRLVAPFVGGSEISRVWDPRPGVAENFASLFIQKPFVCERPEEVSDGVDLIFLADCNGEGVDHYRLAAPGLKKGIPTFIDKPLADTLKQARRIEALASKHEAPVMSISLLQVSELMRAFRSRLPEIGRVDSGVVTGFSLHPAGLIHSICAVQGIFGSGIEEVCVSETPGGPLIHLGYGERTDRPSRGVVIRCGEADYRWTAFYASAHGFEGAIQAAIYSDFRSQGAAEVISLITEMVKSGKISPLHHEMIQAVAVMDAVRMAGRSGRPRRVASID
jgi:hypothetical protein